MGLAKILVHLQEVQARILLEAFLDLFSLRILQQLSMSQVI